MEPNTQNSSQADSERGLVVRVTVRNLKYAMDDETIPIDPKRIKRVHEYALHHAITAACKDYQFPSIDSGLGMMLDIINGLNMHDPMMKKVAETLGCTVVQPMTSQWETAVGQIAPTIDQYRRGLLSSIEKELLPLISPKEAPDGGRVRQVLNLLQRTIVDHHPSKPRSLTAGEILDAIQGSKPLPVAQPTQQDWAARPASLKPIPAYRRLCELLSRLGIYDDRFIDLATDWGINLGFRHLCQIGDSPRKGILNGHLVQVDSIPRLSQVKPSDEQAKPASGDKEPKPQGQKKPKTKKPQMAEQESSRDPSDQADLAL